MAIAVTRDPDALSNANFTPTPGLIDDRDRTPIDAQTNFDFQLVALIGPAPPGAGTVDEFTRRVDGQLALREDVTLTLTPKCKRLPTVTVAGDLLSHEQFHWDCAFVVARAVARQYALMRAPNLAALIARKGQIDSLHFGRRNDLIQQRYDIDTHHGTNAHYQKIWKDRMRACLADARATQIGGFWL